MIINNVVVGMVIMEAEVAIMEVEVAIMEVEAVGAE
jgi:hypothetical protein